MSVEQYNRYQFPLMQSLSHFPFRNICLIINVSQSVFLFSWSEVLLPFFLLFFYYNCKELPPPPSLISLQTSQSTVTPAWPHLPGCPWPLPRGVQCPAPQLNISSHASSYSTIALLLVSYKILSHAFQNDTLQLFLVISVLLHQNF